MSEYVVAIKPSARRRSPATGEWVNREGPHRRFDSKALAREWARRHSGHGYRLWVQDAPPHDDTGVDGYLVGADRPTVGGAGDSAGEQAPFERF